MKKETKKEEKKETTPAPVIMDANERRLADIKARNEARRAEVEKAMKRFK